MKLSVRSQCILGILGALILLASAAGAFLYRYPLWLYDAQVRLHLWRADVRSEYVVAEGQRMHYFEGQPPDGSPGIPLVLVHGLGARGEDWSPMIPTLMASGFHVYAPDLLGFGRSDKPEVSYSISLEESSLYAFLRAVDVPLADVGGWSMGGWVAAKLALDHPEMVDRLVLYDSAGLTFKPSFRPDIFVPSDSASLDGLMAILTPKPLSIPPFIARAAVRRVQEQSRYVTAMMNAMETGRDVLDQRLTSLEKPTLIMWGTEDKLIPIAVGQRMHQEIRNSLFEGIAGCGHLAPSECSAAALTGTIKFLRAPSPQRGGQKWLPGTAESVGKMPAATTH